MSHTSVTQPVTETQIHKKVFHNLAKRSIDIDIEALVDDLCARYPLTGAAPTMTLDDIPPAVMAEMVHRHDLTIPVEGTGLVLWWLVRLGDPQAGGVTPEDAGIAVPNVVNEWFRYHARLDEDPEDDEVFLLITPNDTWPETGYLSGIYASDDIDMPGAIAVIKRRMALANIDRVRATLAALVPQCGKYLAVRRQGELDVTFCDDQNARTKPADYMISDQPPGTYVAEWSDPWHRPIATRVITVP